MKPDPSIRHGLPGWRQGRDHADGVLCSANVPRSEIKEEAEGRGTFAEGDTRCPRTSRPPKFLASQVAHSAAQRNGPLT